MGSNTTILDETLQQVNWREVYESHLLRCLGQTINFVSTENTTQVKTHIISILTLLEESGQFTSLKEKRICLIDTIHPLPLRWGLSYKWEASVREVINNPGLGINPIKYHADLAELNLITGRIKNAIEECDNALNKFDINELETANVVRIKYLAFRTLGEPEKAEEIFEKYGSKFNLLSDYSTQSEIHLQAWLKSNFTRLELLREKGKVEDALALVEKMIELDEKQTNTEARLSVELYIHRSTLLWVTAHYPESIKDLETAVSLSKEQEDLFTAESLKSNLGLVYWTMGELEKAEKYLLEAIAYYQKCGADQLLTYDIGNLGLVYFARGDLQKAKEKTHEHIRHAERVGFTTEAFRGHTNLGDILFYFGKYADAINEHEEVDGYFEKRGSREGYGLGKVWVALSKAGLGESEIAIEELRTILEWCSQHQSKVLEALTHRALAYLLPVSERESHLYKSLTLARAQGRQLEEAACLLMLANVRGSKKGRSTTWNLGVEILERIGASSWLKGASIENPPFIPMFV